MVLPCSHSPWQPALPRRLPRGTTPQNRRAPVNNGAVFGSEVIDISEDWGDATACLVWPDQLDVPECFGTEAELEKRVAGIESEGLGQNLVESATMARSAKLFRVPKTLRRNVVHWLDPLVERTGPVVQSCVVQLRSEDVFVQGWSLFGLLRGSRLRRRILVPDQRHTGLRRRINDAQRLEQRRELRLHHVGRRGNARHYKGASRIRSG